jgi:predicted nucleic acid-binding protein
VNYLLDTNVVSEWVKPRPEPSVVEWLADVDEDRVFLSVVTLAELRNGIESLPAGQRRRRLGEWLTFELRTRFEGRIIAVDERIADRWGAIVAARTKAGRPIGAMDGLLAATADIHALTIVTRNASDFDAAGPAVFNPWRS